jgi:hypothetical protein
MESFNKVIDAKKELDEMIQNMPLHINRAVELQN